MVAHNLTEVFEYQMKKPQVVPSGECSRCSKPDSTICCSNQQSANEATSHDGSFDHSVSSQELSDGWRMHHAYLLSRNAESRVI